MATDFNALYKEFLTRLKDNDFYADFLSFISRGDNYRLSYDNQIITFMQAGSAFELHTYNDYIQKGYKPFGSYSALLYKRFDLSEGNRKLWADDSVRKIGSVENTDKVNESDKYHAEFPVISDNAVLDRLYSALQNDGIFSHKWDENSDIKEKIKNSISDLTRTLVRGILGGKDSENVSRSALVYYGNMESAVEFGMLSKLGMADEHEYNALVNPFSALEGDIDRKTADLYFFSLHDCLMAVEEPIYQCFIKNKAEITDGYEIINNKLVASVTEPVMEKETDYDLRGHEGDAEEGRVGEVRASDRGRAEDTSGGVAELQEEQDEIRRQAQIPGTLSGRVSEGFGLLDSDNNGRATGTADSDIQPSSSPDNLGNASGLRSSVDEQRRDELSFRVLGRQSEPEPERSGENDSRGEMEVLLRDGRLSSGRTAEGSGKADVTDSGLRGLQPAVSEPGNGGVVSGQRSEFQDGHDNGHSTAGNSVQILQGDGSIRQVHSTADEGDGKEGAVSVQNDRQPVPSGSNGDGRGEAGVRPSAASIHNGADAEAVRSANLTDDYTDNLLADSSGQLSFDFTGINEAEKRKKVDSFLDDVQNGSFVPEYDSDDESIRVDVSNPGQSQNINRDNFAKYDIDSQLSFLPEEPTYEGYTYQGFIRDMMADRKNTSDFNYVRTSDNKVVPTFIASALLAGTCYQGDKVDIADYFVSSPHSLNGDDCEFLKQKYNGKGKGFVYTDLDGDRRFGFFIPSDFPYHSDDISKYEQSGLFIGRYEPNDDGRMVFKKAFVSWKYIAFGLDNMIYDMSCYTHIPLYDEKSESHKFIGYDDYPSYFDHKTDEFKNYIKQSKVKLVAFYKHKKEFDSYASDPHVSDLSYKHQEQLCSDYLSSEAYVPYAVFAPKNYAPSIGDKFSIDDLKNPKNPHDGELLYLSLAVHQYHIPMKVGDVISIHEKDGSETYHYCNPSSDGTLLYEKVDDSFFPLTLEETSFLRHFLNPEDSRYQIDAYDIVDEHDAEIINSINEKLGDKQLTVQIGSLINALNGKVSEYLNKSSKLLQNDVSEINDNVIDSSIKEGDSADDEKAGNPEKQVQNIEETKTDSDTISESDTLNNASDVSEKRSESVFDNDDVSFFACDSNDNIVTSKRFTAKELVDYVKEANSKQKSNVTQINGWYPIEEANSAKITYPLRYGIWLHINDESVDDFYREDIPIHLDNLRSLFDQIDEIPYAFDRPKVMRSIKELIGADPMQFYWKKEDLDYINFYEKLPFYNNYLYYQAKHPGIFKNDDNTVNHRLSFFVTDDTEFQRGYFYHNYNTIEDAVYWYKQIISPSAFGDLRKSDVEKCGIGIAIDNGEDEIFDWVFVQGNEINYSELENNNKEVADRDDVKIAFVDTLQLIPSLVVSNVKEDEINNIYALDSELKEKFGVSENEIISTPDSIPSISEEDSSAIEHVEDNGSMHENSYDSVDDINSDVSDNEEDASDDQLPSSDILEDAGGEAVSDDVETSYYTYPSNFKSPSGIKNRLSKNIAAIKVLKEINHRPATKEEQQILSEYTGFGGLQLVFDERAEAYENERAELKEVLSKEEYHSAQSSIMDAFYTPKEVVESVYECLEKMGFRGGKVLDPSMGVGRFYSFMPKEMRENSELYGVEIDGITEKIAALLNPDCKSYNLPFEDADVIYDSAHRKPFDLVISNIPFGELRIKDSDFKKAYRIHDYFFMKALNLVKEGGIVAFITSTGTLDKLDARMRDDVFKQADLVAAYRLPNNIFSNTSVSSDIIFLQKGRANRVISDAVFNSENAEDYGFRNVIANDYGIAYNNYYFEHPDMLLGRMENSGRFGGSVCVPYLEGTFTEHFKSSVLPQIPENIVAETVITKEKDISSDGLNNNPEVSDNDYPSEKVINETEEDFTFAPLDDDKSDTENSLELGDEIDYSEVKENLNPDDLPYLDVNPGALFVYSGKVYRRQSQSAYSPCYRVVPAFAKKSKNVFKTFKNWEKKAIRLINLRNSFRKLVYLELNDSLEEDIENERANLNRQYNEFVVKYGFLSKKDQLKGFVTENFDQDSQLFTAFEDTEKYIDENGEEKERIVKAGIFSKRQYTAYIPPVHADSIEDALNIAYVEKNEVDFDRISSLLDGMSKDDIIKNLKGQIFKDPETYSPSHPYDGYLIKEDYLSGNVREKLNLAKTKAAAFAETDAHIFEENIEALEKVVPKDIPAEEISVDIGAPWIDPQDYRKFMSELTHTYIGFFDVKYFSLTSTYYVENRTTNSFSEVFDSAECETVFGTQYMNFYKIFENLLNQRPIKVEIKAKDSEGNEYVLQQPSYEATVEAKTKAEEIKAQFKDWIFSDTERREKYVRLYNDRFNSTVLRQYDGSYMEFPGINSAIQLYDYQKDGISRCIRGGNTLLAYCVGAGKSFMMIASAMEMKRLGLCRKSLIVVPKATVPQMYSEFKRLYPNSNALMITSGNFTKKKRAQFLANVALGNYDAIIMSHDQFNMVKLSDERRREYITAEIEQLQDYLSNVKNEDSTERFTIRQIEKEIEKLQTNLDKVGKTSTDTIFTFEELGVDALFLDEAHNYKNMYFATKLSNISGVSTSASERSLNLSFILQYLAEINHGYRNVIFATGTPVSNSMSEMYNFTRFLRPDLLKASGLYAFDAWASTFGDVTHNLEPKPDGNGFQFKDRFAKFKNLPELTTMYRSFADVKLLSDIKDHLDAISKLKNGKPTIIKCEPNDVIKAAMKEFSERSERVHSNGFIAQKGEDNYLKIINDGRKLSVDTQLYLPSAPEYEGSKINACVREVFRIYNETASFKGTQAIFLDAGVPNGQTYVNLYKKIKDKLTALGVPSEEIAFVQNYGDEKKKDMLMSSLNNGNIRIVLGSTQTLGTGCNFQERLYAIHELDAPWTPASVEQREGRIIRQGNKNPEVEIYRYIMQDTFDTFNWTTLDRKKDFIDQSISGTFEGRDVEDAEMAASYADIKQACTTNPYIQKKFENDNKISILSAQKKAFKSNNYHIQSELHNLPKYKKMYEENISDFSKDIEARDKYKEELSKKIAAYNEKCEDPKKKIAVTDTPFEITIGDTTYYNRNEANDKIIKIFEAMENGDQKTIGKYYGFSLVASRECMDKSAGNGYINYSITIRGTTNYTANFEISGKDGRGNMMKLQNQLLKMEEYKARNEKMLEDAKAKEAVLKEQVDKPFEGEAELAQCLKDREEFELRINEFEAEHASEEEDYSYIDLEEYKRIPGEDKISEADVVDEPVGVHDISVSDEVEENDQEKHTEESHNEIAEAYDADITDKEKGQDNEDLDDDISDNMAINANSRK